MCIDTHQSATALEYRLYRNSNAAPALPSYLGRVLTDNRHGLVVDVQASPSEGTAERDIAAQMLVDVAKPDKRVTVDADKAYATWGFMKACREIDGTPHVAQNTRRIGGITIDGRTTKHVGYEVSQRKRKRIEQCFGWGKLVDQKENDRRRVGCRSGKRVRSWPTPRRCRSWPARRRRSAPRSTSGWQPCPWRCRTSAA